MYTTFTTKHIKNKGYLLPDTCRHVDLDTCRLYNRGKL